MRKLSVSPSVCPSVKRVDCGKTEERSVQLFIPYEISFSLVAREDEWMVWGDPFYYITVAEDRPIMSVKHASQFQSFTFGQNYNAPCSAVSLR